MWFLSLGLSLGLALSGAAQAACGAAPLEPAMFDRLITEAEAAFASADDEGLTASANGLVRRLPCLSGPITPAEAGATFRLLGLVAHIDRSRNEAQRDFAASRFADPTWDFPADTFPPEHPLRESWRAISTENPPMEVLTPPSEGQLLVNGVAATSRPTAWPAIVQWIDGAGKVRFTVLIRPRDILPAYPTAEHPVVVDAPPPTEPEATPAAPEVAPSEGGDTASAEGDAGGKTNKKDQKDKKSRKDEPEAPVTDAAKLALAAAVRRHYQAHPEAIALQATGGVAVPTVANHR